MIFGNNQHGFNMTESSNNNEFLSGLVYARLIIRYNAYNGVSSVDVLLFNIARSFDAFLASFCYIQRNIMSVSNT